MKKITGMPLAVIAVLAAAVSCTKQPLDNLSNEEARVYITSYDSSASFSAFKTFSVTDSVAVVRNNRLSSKAVTPTDSAFISAVTALMRQRGYTLVNKGQKPDLGVSLTRIYSSSTGVVDYGSYWDAYYGYWDPYYWGYPGYPYYADYVGVYTITDAAVAIDLVDLRDAASTNKIKSVWSGLIRGGDVINQAGAPASVQALFAQSPYLKSGQ